MRSRSKHMSKPGPSAARVVLLALVVLQVLLFGATAWFDLLVRGAYPGLGEPLGVILDFTANLVFPAVGLFIVTKRPDNSVGWLFAAGYIGWALVNSAGAFARWGAVQVSAPPGYEFAIWLYTWPSAISLALMTLLVLLFPTGTFASSSWRIFGKSVSVFSFLGAVVFALAPGPVDGTIGLVVVNPLGAPDGVGDLLAQIVDPVFLVLYSSLLVSIGSVFLRQRRATGVERVQLKWFTAAFVAIVFALLGQLLVVNLYGAAKSGQPWVAQMVVRGALLSGSLLPVAAGIAILRYHLYDIDRIISRTLTYGALTATLSGGFLLAVLALQSLLPVPDDSPLIVAVSTLGVIAAFGPLQRRFQSAVDHRFDRGRYDATRAIETFGTRLRNTVDIESVESDLVGTVHNTMRPAHVSLWLKPGAKP
ncbi:hypothetical protein BH20ACT23_BH20ACT23_25730 [soil metagenome]